ncbi:MAG TPA: HAD family hydrolase [Myxococcota bacterium]|nr:HAD family hydrolase [Myxococcota bacterium]
MRGGSLRSPTVALRAVLFDLFDTLVDLHMDRLPEVQLRGRRLRSTYPFLYDAVRSRLDPTLSFEAFADVLAGVDQEVHGVMHTERREVPTRQRFQRLVERLALDAPGLPELLTEVHMERMVRCVSVPDHHVPLLADLHRGLKLGVCSNFTHTPAALRVLEEAGLAPHLDAIVVSEEIGVRKPRKEIFDEALRRLSVSASEAVHVGDNLAADVAGAAGVGMRTIWLTRCVQDTHAALRGYTGPWPAGRLSDLAGLPGVLPTL